MKIIRMNSVTATPWKNGGGVTHELIRVPPGDGPFRWRMSVAHIDAAGPFSDFAGYNRTMVLLRGAGVRLTFDGDRSHELCGVGELAQFDGACATHCELLQGSCADLNFIVSQSIEGARAWVERLAAPRLLSNGHATVLALPLDGSVSVDAGSGEASTLAAWDLAVAWPPDHLRIVASPAACAAPLVFCAAINDNSR